MQKKKYPSDIEMQDYIFNNQLIAFEYMQNVSDIEIFDFAVSQYKDDYEMQKHNYEKNIVAKKFMVFAYIFFSRNASNPNPWWFSYPKLKF